MKAFRSYTLRGLFAVVTLAALASGLWERSRRLRVQAAQHHYQAMESGYTAAAFQPQGIREWDPGGPPPIQMDRESVAQAIPYWQLSVHHAHLRDTYLAASKRPWLPVGTVAEPPAPLALPKDAAHLPEWWNEHFGEYVSANSYLLNRGGFTTDDPNWMLTRELLSDDELASLANRFAQRQGLPKQSDNTESGR